MSTSRFQLTDADLDQALDTYLLEAPITAAERVAEQAMLAVATTRQRGRGWLGAFGPSTARTALATAAVVVAIVGGFGLWRIVDISVSPTPKPSPTPTVVPSPSPDATPAVLPLKTFSHPELGWSVTLPSGWTELSRDGLTVGYSGIRDGILRITVGNVDGTIEVCLAIAPCGTVVATSLDQFETEVFGAAPDPTFETRVESTIDGEPAVEWTQLNLDGRFGGAPDRYLLAWHGDTPLLIHYDASDDEMPFPLQWGQIRAGFQFIDPVLFERPADGYALNLTDRWSVSESGLVTFLGPTGRSFRIVAGTTDGRIAVCGIPFATRTEDCPEHTYTDAAAMVELLPGPGNTMGVMTTDREAIDLGGESVRLYELFSFDGIAWAVLAVHDGRPCVLVTSASYASDTLAVFRQLIASFVWLP